MVWLFGVVVLPDESGRERMLAFFQRRRGLGAVLENGFVVYNDEKDVFEKIKDVPLDPPIYPTGYPFRVKHDDGTEYVYFTAPYPALRVRADWKSYLDLSSYEGYTCLKPGTRYGSKDHVQLDRDSDGKLVWGWKKDTPPLNPKDQEDLIAAGKMKREESPFRLQDADGGKPILLNNCSCFWNDYRKRYIMIASEAHGRDDARRGLVQRGRPARRTVGARPQDHHAREQEGRRPRLLQPDPAPLLRPRRRPGDLPRRLVRQHLLAAIRTRRPTTSTTRSCTAWTCPTRG